MSKYIILESNRECANNILFVEVLSNNISDEYELIVQ